MIKILVSMYLNCQNADQRKKVKTNRKAEEKTTYVFSIHFPIQLLSTLELQKKIELVDMSSSSFQSSQLLIFSSHSFHTRRKRQYLKVGGSSHGGEMYIHFFLSSSSLTSSFKQTDRTFSNTTCIYLYICENRNNYVSVKLEL